MANGFFIWWYGAGFSQSWEVALYFLARTGQFFSLESLFRTWFYPWKNDVSVGYDLSLSQQINLWSQNLVSRLVGATVRSVFILLGFCLLAVVAFLLVAGLIIWLLTPLLIFVLPVMAVKIAYYT